MNEHLTSREILVQAAWAPTQLFRGLEESVNRSLDPTEAPIRFAVTRSDEETWHCEVNVHAGGGESGSIFAFAKRAYEDTTSFNVVMLVPTGIGAEVGGHAGDATPAATLISGSCDSMITHPNVLNASDLIQVPENALYVEGSVITQVLMGTSRLLPTRSNKLLVIVQAHEDQIFTDAAVNAVNAARAYFGLQTTEVVVVGPSFQMSGGYGPSGSAGGTIHGIENIWEILDARRGEFDAVALSSVIEIPADLHSSYYYQKGDLINPWGGVEAMLTHAISLKYGVPSAHSPMLESRAISELDVGVVDARMAAEVISVTFFQSVLRGLQRSPLIVGKEMAVRGGLGAESISCLIIPDGCLGLPTLAALQQGIKVIAVRENANIMRNDLSLLPWNEGQFFQVENYWEAVGVTNCLRMGIDPYSVRRPLKQAQVTYNCHGIMLPVRGT